MQEEEEEVVGRGPMRDEEVGPFLHRHFHDYHHQELPRQLHHHHHQPGDGGGEGAGFLPLPSSSSSSITRKRKSHHRLLSTHWFSLVTLLLVLLLLFLAVHVRDVVQKANKANRLKEYAKRFDEVAASVDSLGIQSEKLDSSFSWAEQLAARLRKRWNKSGDSDDPQGERVNEET